MKTVDNEFQEMINASCKSPSNRTDAANVISHKFFQHTTYLRSDLDLGSVAAREKRRRKKQSRNVIPSLPVFIFSRSVNRGIVVLKTPLFSFKIPGKNRP